LKNTIPFIIKMQTCCFCGMTLSPKTLALSNAQ